MRNLVRKVVEFLDVIRASSAVAASVRNHQRPRAADLKVLGIGAASFSSIRL